MFKYIGIFLFTICNFTYASDIINEINYSKNDNELTIIENLKNNFSIQYFVNFSGPTLANLDGDYTYSRFQSGKTWDGKFDLDSKMNLNYFNSISLSYQASGDISVFYSYAFDNVITKNVTYKSKISKCQFDVKKNECLKDKDGFYLLDKGYFEVTNKRNELQSFYNQRVGVFISNISDNKSFGISSGLTLELPTTEGAKNDGLNYALILTPSIYFKNISMPHSLGITTEFAFNSYQQNIIKGTDGANARKMRTAQITISPYYNFQLTKNLKLNSSLIFDWDQSGNQLGSFNSNMDDVYRVGLGNTFSDQISANLYIEGALEKASASRSFIGANLAVRL